MNEYGPMNHSRLSAVRTSPGSNLFGLHGATEPQGIMQERPCGRPKSGDWLAGIDSLSRPLGLSEVKSVLCLATKNEMTLSATIWWIYSWRVVSYPERVEQRLQAGTVVLPWVVDDSMTYRFGGWN